MVSPVTPGAVAPPLLPVNGLTQGGAYVSGTATVPRVVSHFGPHLTESLFAVENTTGPLAEPLGAGGFGELPLSLLPLRTSTATTTTTTTPTTGV